MNRSYNFQLLYADIRDGIHVATPGTATTRNITNSIHNTNGSTAFPMRVTLAPAYRRGNKKAHSDRRSQCSNDNIYQNHNAERHRRHSDRSHDRHKYRNKHKYKRQAFHKHTAYEENYVYEEDDNELAAAYIEYKTGNGSREVIIGKYPAESGTDPDDQRTLADSRQLGKKLFKPPEA